LLCYSAEIGRVQGEYTQEREYGFAPSFARTQRVHASGSDFDGSLSSSSLSLYTVLDDTESAGPSSSFYCVLPTCDLDCHSSSSSSSSDMDFLLATKQRLETLVPSQRDYVSAQVLRDVR
jgi:hypothetical protein